MQGRKGKRGARLLRESPSVECVPRKDSEFLMWQVRESLAAGAGQLITFSSPTDRTRNSRASISFFVSKQKSQAKKNDVLSLAASLDPGVDRVLPLASRDVVRRAGRERTAAVSFPRRHQATRIATENSLSTSTPLHPLSLPFSLSLSSPPQVPGQEVREAAPRRPAHPRKQQNPQLVRSRAGRGGPPLGAARRRRGRGPEEGAGLGLGDRGGCNARRSLARVPPDRQLHLRAQRRGGGSLPRVRDGPTLPRRQRDGRGLGREGANESFSGVFFFSLSFFSWGGGGRQKNSSRQKQTHLSLSFSFFSFRSFSSIDRRPTQ